MDLANSIALAAALAAWAAIILQWRANRATEKDISGRIDVLRELIDRIETEKNTRERQIRERILNDLRVQRDHAGSTISLMGLDHDVLVLRQAVIWTQMAALYLAHHSRSAESDAEVFSRFVSAIGNAMNCLGSQNTLRLLANGGGDQGFG